MKIVRRGGRTWEAFLKTKLEALNKSQRTYGEKQVPNLPGTGRLYNLELVTALRRVQKKPDPLVVLLDVQGPLEANPLLLPRLKVSIKNVDCEKAGVGFTNGGDYRSGRQDRWRVVVGQMTKARCFRLRGDGMELAAGYTGK